ncbi:hypothetical protein HY745_14655 [Candidatus Desantisbacteria bacterium]|nr:hypothetical protein [Candidatus Desantisbacteria bacterium]
MSDNSNLKQHISLFIYPFHFTIPDKHVIEKLMLSDSLWKQLEVDQNTSEYLYFVPSAKDLLFKNRFELKNPSEFKIKYKTCLYQINSIYLNLMPNNIAMLSFDIKNIAEKDEYNLNSLLDFNESFRYVSDIYKDHSASRNGLTIESSFFNLQNGLTENLIDFLFKPIFSNEKDEKQYKRLFDERMISLSMASLDEKLSDELSYKFFNVDSSNMQLPDDEYIKKYLEENTYKRWRDKGVFYGFTHYGFGCISFGDNKWLLEVFRRQYSDLAIIICFQYGVLKLINEQLLLTNTRNTNKIDELNELFKDFIKDYWFDLITNQDQGREIFLLWKSIFEKEYHLWEIINGKFEILYK